MRVFLSLRVSLKGFLAHQWINEAWTYLQQIFIFDLLLKLVSFSSAESCSHILQTKRSQIHVFGRWIKTNVTSTVNINKFCESLSHQKRSLALEKSVAEGSALLFDVVLLKTSLKGITTVRFKLQYFRSLATFTYCRVYQGFRLNLC